MLGHSESVNRINSASVAAERGIRIHEEKREPASGGAGSVLKLKLHTRAGDTFASATVLHGNSPRLLSFNGIDVETPLQGKLLCLTNRDVPGVIGRIGTILGEHQINIANFALGRADGHHGVPRGNALAVIQIDTDLTPAVLEALRKVEGILHVEQVSLGNE